MKYVFTLLILSLLGCSSKEVISAKSSKEFEDVFHYPYELTANKFLFIDTQPQMDAVFSIIHQKSGGIRSAPIPTVSTEESYLILKPLLRNTNDVEIKEIYTEKDTLFITVKEFNNPHVESSSRKTPNILLKLLKKVSVKKLVINYATK